MVSRIIQAVAGAGKTYAITHDMLDLSKKYLFITFTNGNAKNIRDGLTDFGFPIDQYQVMTFSKFVIDWLVKPFLPIMEPGLVMGFSGGFTTQDPQPAYKNGGYNRAYIKKTEVGHYLDMNGNFYLTRLSGFATAQNNDYWKAVWRRVSKFVDEIFIDEYQDLTGKDFDILTKMAKQRDVDVTLVGDVYQSNVSRSMKLDKPKLDFKGTSIEDGLHNLFGRRVIVDSETMKSSRRISPQAAALVSSKLDIPIESMGIASGKVTMLTTVDEIIKELETNPMVLIWDRDIGIPDFSQYRTWSYSKGDTFGRVMVVLTKKTDDILEESFIRPDNMVRNKLYVALTRSSGELYLVQSSAWKKVIKHLNDE